MRLKSVLCSIAFLYGSFLFASHDKYRLTLRDDPATTITIAWNQIGNAVAKVYFDTVDHGENYQAYQYSQNPDRSVDFKEMNNQFVRLSNLQPDTPYYFIIVDNEQISRRFWFRTATSDNSRISFIAGGDSRNNRTPRKNANLLVSKLKPNAVLFGGDMTDDDTVDEWIAWFDDWQYTIAEDGRMFPLIAARGDHEESNESVYNLFDTPSDKIYYAITFGENLIRAYTLNSEISIAGNQNDWFTQDLKNSQHVFWRIVQYHQPMRPHIAYKPEGNNQYNHWASLFYEQRVRLVVESDGHTVKSTWPLRPSNGEDNEEGFVRDDKNGTTYIGEGCWGAPLRTPNDNKNWTRDSGVFNQFKWIFVDRDKIETRTIKVDNAVQVGSVTNNNRFEVPLNLDIWNPSNGSVVTILNNDKTDLDPDLKRLTAIITNGNDDVEEDKEGNLIVDSGDLELVYDRQNNQSFQKIGLRFETVQIPKNAIVERAYLQFTADEDEGEATKLQISIEDSADSGAFSNDNNISSRKVKAVKVTWSPELWYTNQSGLAQQSPDIKELIQQIINQSDWKTGNSLSLFISGLDKSLRTTTARRSAESFEAGVTKAAKLVIDYKINTLDNQAVSDNTGGLKNVAIVPNPFKESVRIYGINNLLSPVSNSCNVTIYSISGQKVFSKDLSLKLKGQVVNGYNFEPKIKSSGIYFLNITDPEGTVVFTEKVFKQ